MRTRVTQFAFSITGFGLLLFGAGLNARADEWNKRWSVGAKPELRVTAGDASIVLEVGSGDAIEAVLRTRGVSIGDSGVKVSEHQTGDRVEIEVREPATHFSFGMRSIELSIRVPRDLTVDLRTGDGSIRLRGVHGSIRAATGDGSVEGDNLDGSLDLRTGDGSLHIKGRFDLLQLRTSDGSVDMQAFSGSRMRSGWRIETGDGSVRVALPRDLAADVQLRTGDGSIHTDLPLSIEGIKSEHDIHGKLNGGGPVLEVRTGEGSISLNAM